MRKAFHLVSLLLAAGVGLVAVAGAAADPALRRVVSEACPGCGIDWDGFSLGWGRVTFRRVRFDVGDPRFTQVEGEVREVTVRLSFRELARKRAVARLVELDGPTVRVNEGDGVKPPSAATETEPRSGWVFGADRIDIANGAFVYTRTRGGRPGSIHVSSIEGVVGPWSTARADQWTKGEASGRLEKSGRFLLSVEAPLFSGPFRAKVGLRIRGQRLADLNPFFSTDQGLELEGELLHGTAWFSATGRTGDSWARAAYRDFGVKFRATRDRTALAAFFANLLTSAKLEDSQPSGPPSGKAARIERGGESVVSFVLRGWRDAALRMASKAAADEGR